MIVKENDYLSHYGRKGMKWYQHIFGDKSKVSKEKRKQIGKTATIAALGTVAGYQLGKRAALKKKGRTYVIGKLNGDNKYLTVRK